MSTNKLKLKWFWAWSQSKRKLEKEPREEVEDEERRTATWNKLQTPYQTCKQAINIDVTKDELKILETWQKMRRKHWKNRNNGYRNILSIHETTLLLLKERQWKHQGIRKLPLTRQSQNRNLLLTIFITCTSSALK